MKKVKYIILFNALLFAGLLTAAQTPDANGILYVKKGATGTGISWSNAVGEVADGLKAAKTNAAIKQIWVARGVYMPLYSPGDDNFGASALFDNAFLLVKDVKLYGGFDPNAGITNLTHNRILPGGTSNGSILSGDLGDLGTFSDNVYHVVISAGDVGSAELNGFTITAGYARSQSSSASSTSVNTLGVYSNNGGGIYTISSAPILTHLNISDNMAFTGNSLACLGGGMYITGTASPKLTNVLISKNTAKSAGNGVYSTTGIGEFTNVTLVGNGGYTPFYADGSHWNNSIIWENYASSSGLILQHCLVQNSNNTTNGNKSAVGLSADNIFKDYANGDYSLKGSSPAINAGNNSYFPGLDANMRDLAGFSRVYKFATGGTIDMGAYEYQGDPILSVQFGTLNAVIKDQQLLVNWSTETETHNDHFLIQASNDGVNFKTIQTVQSKAADGNSNGTLEYSSTIALSTITAAGLLLLIFGIGSASVRKRKYGLCLLLLGGVLFFSCHKTELQNLINDGKLFVRIVQVDKDGTERISKVIQVVKE